MTQETLAKRANLSKTTISNLEVGHQTKIALDTIAKLCRALDCTPSDLFEFQENKHEQMHAAQAAALEPYIGVLEYDKKFDSAELDKDLADITDKKKRRSSH